MSARLAISLVSRPSIGQRLLKSPIAAKRSLQTMATPLYREFQPIDAREKSRLSPSSQVPDDVLKRVDPTMAAEENAKHGQYRPEHKPNDWRWIGNEGEPRTDSKGQPPDANDLQDKFSDKQRADTKKDYEYIRSQTDKANYPAPKRLSSLKDAIHEDMKHAQHSFEAARDAVKDTISELPDKARKLEHKIEERGEKLASKIKNFVKRDSNDKQD